MLKDLRHAVRGLMRAKGWTAVVILSLALGIGANTAIFTGVNALLLTQIPVRDPDTLVRLRYGGRNDMVTSSSDYGFTAKGPRRAERPDDVLVPDVSAVPRRQPDHVGPDGVRPVRARQRRRRRPGGDCERVHRDRQLLPGAGGRRPDRPDHRSRRRQADRAAGGGDQLEVLAHALRHRSGRARQDDPGQQRGGDDRRRAAAGVHRRAAAGGGAARHHAAAGAGSAARHRPRHRARSGWRSRPTGGCRSWDG